MKEIFCYFLNIIDKLLVHSTCVSNAPRINSGKLFNSPTTNDDEISE